MSPHDLESDRKFVAFILTISYWDTECWHTRDICYDSIGISQIHCDWISDLCSNFPWKEWTSRSHDNIDIVTQMIDKLLSDLRTDIHGFDIETFVFASTEDVRSEEYPSFDFETKSICSDLSEIVHMRARIIRICLQPIFQSIETSEITTDFRVNESIIDGYSSIDQRDIQFDDVSSLCDELVDLLHDDRLDLRIKSCGEILLRETYTKSLWRSDRGCEGVCLSRGVMRIVSCDDIEDSFRIGNTLSKYSYLIK